MKINQSIIYADTPDLRYSVPGLVGPIYGHDDDKPKYPENPGPKISLTLGDLQPLRLSDTQIMAHSRLYVYNEQQGPRRISLLEIKKMNTKIETVDNITDVNYDKLLEDDYVFSKE